MRSHPPPPDRSQFAPALTLRRQENGCLRARRKCHGAQGSIDASCVIANDPIHCVELARRVASGFHAILKCPVRLPVIVIRPEGGVARSIEYLDGDHDPVAAQSDGARPRIAPLLFGSWCTRCMRRWRLASAGGGGCHRAGFGRPLAGGHGCARADTIVEHCGQTVAPRGALLLSASWSFAYGPRRARRAARRASAHAAVATPAMRSSAARFTRWPSNRGA